MLCLAEETLLFSAIATRHPSIRLADAKGWPGLRFRVLTLLFRIRILWFRMLDPVAPDTDRVVPDFHPEVPDADLVVPDDLGS